MASTQKDLLDAISSDINGLGLSGMEKVVVRSSPNDNGQFYPGITVHAVSETEILGTNERDDIGYGIQITMVVNDDNDLDEDDLLGVWRQTIRKKFIHQRITGVSNVCTTQVEPGKVYNDNNHDLQISTLLLRVFVRETRG